MHKRVTLIVLATLFSCCLLVHCGGGEKTSIPKEPICITVEPIYFNKTPFMGYGSAVDFLGKKKYWLFKYELTSNEGVKFDSSEYLKRYPLDAVWKFYTGDGQYGVKIWTNNPGEKQRDGFIKLKVMIPPEP